MSAAGVGAPGAPAPGPAAGVVPPGLSAAAVAAGAPGAAPPSAPASAAGPPASAAASAAPPATAAEREARRREHNKKRDQASRGVEGDLRKLAYEMVGADKEPAKSNSSQESKGARQMRKLIGYPVAKRDRVEALEGENAALRSKLEDLQRQLEAAEKRK